MFARVSDLLANSAALIATAITLAYPRSAPGQGRLEIAPTVGTYIPTSSLPSRVSQVGCPLTGPNPCSPSFGAYGQEQAVAVGGRVAVWVGNRGAIESSFWYAPSRVAGDFEGAAKIVLVSFGFVLNLAPKAPTMSVLLTGGPALIHRFGDFYADVGGTTSAAGALGIALDAHPGRHFRFRAQIEDYLYSVQFAEGTTKDGQAFQTAERQFQHDFVFSLSINPFGQRERRR